MRPTTKVLYERICLYWQKKKGQLSPKEIAKDLGVSVQLVYRANEWWRVSLRGTLTGQHRHKR